MSQIRFTHILKKMHPSEVYNDEDPYFPGYYPMRDIKGAELDVNDIPAEIRKLYNPEAFPEQQSSILGFVYDA
jgi:hypothetical protein